MLRDQKSWALDCCILACGAAFGAVAVVVGCAALELAGVVLD